MMNTDPSQRRPHRGRAFTLVELLVSTAILSVLLVTLAQTASTVANIWTSGNNRAERRQSGRALVDFVARELKGAALPSNLGATTDRPNLQFLMNPPSVPGAFRNPHALFWQAPIATDTSKGNMAEVGYFVKWVGNRAMLCRFFQNPTDPHYFVYTASRQDNWINAQVINDAAPADNATVTGGQPNAYRGLFAENVVGFWTRCLDLKGKALVNTPTLGFDSRLSYKTTDSTGAQVTVAAPALPSSVEVSLVLLDSRSADLMASSSQAAAMQSTIQSLSATATNAADFVALAASKPELSRLLGGMTAHQLRVFLDNAP